MASGSPGKRQKYLKKIFYAFCILPFETSVKRKFAVHLTKNVTIAGNLTAAVSTCLSQPAWASSAQDPLPPFTEVSLYLRSSGCLPESWRKFVVLHKQLFSCVTKISI